MTEQRLAIGVVPVDLADFGARLVGQEIQKFVAPASPRGSSEACSGRRIGHHDEIFRALLGIGLIGRIADADDDRLADGVMFLNPAGLGEGREGGVAVEHIEHRIAALRRSEEHTSELQSLMRISYAVFCLKKKNKIQKQQPTSPKPHLTNHTKHSKSTII